MDWDNTLLLQMFRSFCMTNLIKVALNLNMHDASIVRIYIVVNVYIQWLNKFKLFHKLMICSIYKKGKHVS